MVIAQGHLTLTCPRYTSRIDTFHGGIRGSECVAEEKVSVQTATMVIGQTMPLSGTMASVRELPDQGTHVKDDPFTLMITSAQEGNLAAFDALYEHFASSLFRYLCLRCDDIAVAEDLAGEVWVRVVQRLPAFRIPVGSPEVAFRAWLYCIAHNMVIDTHRRRSSHDVSIPEAMTTGTPTPDEQVIAWEEHGQVRAALSKLNDQQREVLMLRFVEEHSVAEVASLMGRSAGAVRVLQFRALRSLAQKLR
jgi:RNA polymerase sigma-70 factor (ECF subfamily)